MGTVNVFLYSGGEWDEFNSYIGYSVCGLIVPEHISYDALIRLIATELGIDFERYQLTLVYQSFVNGPRIRIWNESSLAFYLDFKKGEADKRTYPICVDVCNKSTLQLNDHGEGLIDNVPSHSSALSTPDEGNIIIMAGQLDNPSLERMGEELSDYIHDPRNEDMDEILEIICQPSCDNVVVGTLFNNKEILVTSVSLYAINKRFQYNVLKSDNKAYVLKCFDESCKWRFRASRTGTEGHFKITKIVDIHTCSNDTILGKHRQATSSLIANCIKHRFLSVRRIYTPSDIIDDMQELYGVTISYDKAWRARERAIKLIRGDQMESYGHIASYMYMIEVANPGSYTKIETDTDDRFLFGFVALGASIGGWRYCKPVIVVDGTFLTSRYGGTLFTACTQDANNNIFILAFGVGDSENNNAWEWFLMRLKEAYGDRDELCIISDRHGSIKHAVERVFPNALHGACTYHLFQNLKKEYAKKGKDMRIPFNRAARAYTLKDFETHMRKLDAIDPRIRSYLKDIGYERWTRSHMTTNRYSTMTSNIVESVNSAIKHAKHYPIVAMFECLRGTIQKWFFNNLSDAKATFTRLSTRHNTMLNERVKMSSRLRVHPSSDILYQVNSSTTSYVVNMEEKTCSCRRFQLDHLPCPHAVAVISKLNYSLADYCSPYFSKENYIAAYQGSIYPLGDKEHWQIPDDVKQRIVLAPLSKRGAGRPRENRYKSCLEYKKKSRCGKCYSYGHNNRTCQNPVPRIPVTATVTRGCLLEHCYCSSYEFLFGFISELAVI